MSKNTKPGNLAGNQDELSGEELDAVSGGLSSKSGIGLTFDDGGGATRSKSTSGEGSSPTPGTIWSKGGLSLTLDD